MSDWWFVTCELGALTTCGEIPEEVTVPVGGRFLLVTKAQEKVCEGHSETSFGLRQFPDH